MWTRAELKTRAKAALKQNYWKLVLVSLVAGAITGSSTSFEFNVESDSSHTDFFAGLAGFESLLAGMAIGFVLLCFFVMVIAIVIGIFVSNPLQVGTNRFFVKSLNKENTEIKELMFAYDNGYMNVVKILFLRDLKIFLWSLLFVIPGIIKAYEYKMIPYILADNPNLTKEEVFAFSKAMMTGNKFETFVLELSFLGWDILSGFTFGLLGIFYVQPYRCLTMAVLYEDLSVDYRQPTMDEQQMEYEEI